MDRELSSFPNGRGAASMRVLVTGVSGFVGGHLAEHLIESRRELAVAA